MDKITMRTVDKLRPMADGKSVVSLKKYIRPLITDLISNVCSLLFEIHHFTMM